MKVMKGFDEGYYYGKGSAYFFGYNLFKYKIAWINKIKELLKYKKEGNLLDIGCAFGYFAFYMKDIGFNVYGIDVSEYAINKCKRILNYNNFFVHDVSKKLPFKKDFFDVITAFDVLEHVKDYRKAMKNITRTLKDNGLLMMSMPIRKDHIFNKIDFDKTHISILGEDEIKELLLKNGFEIQKEAYYLNFLIFLPVPTFKRFANYLVIVSKKD